MLRGAGGDYLPPAAAAPRSVGPSSFPRPPLTRESPLLVLLPAPSKQTHPETPTNTTQVVVYDSLEYCASTKNLASVAHCRNFKLVKGDVASADLVRFVLEAEGVDTVMHFAAQTHVDNSFGNSLAFTVSFGCSCWLF